MAFTPEQVTEAVQTLAHFGGSPKQTREALPFDVSIATLSRWRDEEHAQQYTDELQRVQRDLEADTINTMMRNARRAAEIETELLEKCRNAGMREVPQALRAVADVRAKSVDKVLALTGRTPESEGNGDMRSLLEGMAAKGLLKLSVSLDVQQEPKEIDQGAGQ